MWLLLPTVEKTLRTLDEKYIINISSRQISTYQNKRQWFICIRHIDTGNTYFLTFNKDIWDDVVVNFLFGFDLEKNDDDTVKLKFLNSEYEYGEEFTALRKINTNMAVDAKIYDICSFET